MAASRSVLADSWYAAHLGDVCVPLDSLLNERYGHRLTRLAGLRPVRGLLIFWLGRSYDLIVTEYHAPGALLLLVLEAWVRRRGQRVILLELIRGRSATWRRFLRPFWFALVIRPAVRRAMRRGQVLTSWEQEAYAQMYGVPRERLQYIPWPLRDDNPRGAPSAADGEGLAVVSSGRGACDWDTLFRAAEGAAWDLTVICGKQDLAHVQHLNRHGRARVLCDIPKDEHQRHVAAATVYVLSLKEDRVSSGQIRLMNAIQAGTPVVATSVKGLEGYAVHGETAYLVEPGDDRALREAIEYLLAHPEERAQLAGRALARANGRTFDDYLASIREFVQRALVEA